MNVKWLEVSGEVIMEQFLDVAAVALMFLWEPAPVLKPCVMRQLVLPLP
jgi:hypothetical protein